MVNRADFRKSTDIPGSLLLFLHVFPVPHGGLYEILESSPLLGGSDSSPQTWGSLRTSQEITRWILRQISKSVSHIQKTAESIYNKSYPPRCFQFLASGQFPIRTYQLGLNLKGDKEKCYKYRAAPCTFSHDQVTRQEYTMRVEVGS